MANSSASARRIAPPSANKPASAKPALAAAQAPATSDSDARWAAIHQIQQTLNSLISQEAAIPKEPEVPPAVEKRRARRGRLGPVQNETQTKLLETLLKHEGSFPEDDYIVAGMWLADLADLSGVDKGIVHTQIRKLCYRGKVSMQLEKDESVGKLSFWVSRRIR